jgi:hypothetical protein
MKHSPLATLTKLKTTWCATLEDLVEQQAVVGRDVFQLAHILVAAFDLERTDAGVGERF